MTTKTGPIPPEVQRQMNALNARISNTNLAYSDLLKEVNRSFTVMAATIVELQKENAELKAKTAVPKKPKKA
ncbi:MAG: hypothetical protein NWF06_09765 [Candidatus Bathyarchaeota archaeon]|nr:hypothetical protein [Candidatus Bathyarchaeum sp.]